jgi:hypothetical protein
MLKAKTKVNKSATYKPNVFVAIQQKRSVLHQIIIKENRKVKET